jgi:hypothetical protein
VHHVGSAAVIPNPVVRPPSLDRSSPAERKAQHDLPPSGSSYTFAVWSKDDHAVQRVELYVDGALVNTTTCDDVNYMCALNYKWPLRNEQGSHTATFKVYDWLGNAGSLTVSFTVS